MTEKKRSRARRNQGRPNNRPDGAADKRFPNGISSTVRAIYTSWHSVESGGKVGEEHLNPTTFCEKTNFVDVYNKILANYPGLHNSAPLKPISIISMIDDIDAGGRKNISFYQMRALAQFVGLETGLFLLFTQFVSNERRAIDEENANHRDKTLKMIRAIKKLFSELEEVVLVSNPKETIFTRDIGPNEHVVDILMLKMWSEIYNSQDPSE